jgi:hypothetical protein
VSQPGVGLESAYSGPRVELRPPVYPSPVFRADLALVGAVHLGGGGNQRRHGYRVGDCSAEGGTRLGCVRGALGSICFITRLALIPFTVTRYLPKNPAGSLSMRGSGCQAGRGAPNQIGTST